MTQEVVFDTKGEAEAQQAMDLQDWFTTHTCPIYQSQTVRWARPQRRLDGKWAYPCCPDSSYTGLMVEPYDPSNYPSEDE